jgi:putative phage-type endonuclease
MLINHDFTQDRSKYIGGSDIGAILGLSPFKSPLAVWMEKTGKEVKTVDSLPLRFGSFVEEFVANEYAKATGFALRHDESIYIHPDYSYMSAHIDRFVHTDGLDQAATKILECKTANPFSRAQWGEPGSDQIPLHYLTQVTWYLAITGIERADIAVLIGNTDFRIYTILRDPELENLVLEKAHHFWHEHVLKDIPPPAQTPEDCQLLFQRSDPSKTLEANAETLALLERLQTLHYQGNACDEEITALKTQIMAQMQDAEVLAHQGQVLATWKAPKASYRLDAKRLETEERAIYEKYKVASQVSRRFVLKDTTQARTTTL